MLNRLISVTDGSGELATYSYDAVGNVLSVERAGPATILIASVTPRAPVAGTAVAISGTGFSPDLAQNVVRFNGVAATVTASTLTQLTAVAPAGAGTGPITVSSPAGSDTGPVVSVTELPTLTSFAPSSGPPGTAVTLTGANFDTEATTVRLNGTALQTLSVTSTTVSTIAAAGASSGQFSVTSPGGTAVSASDFIVVPAGQPFSAYPIGYSAAVAIGQSNVVSLTSGTAGYLLFEGTQGSG